MISKRHYTLGSLLVFYGIVPILLGLMNVINDCPLFGSTFSYCT